MPSFSQTILNAVTSHYLSSGDFNGTAISSINGSDKERLEAITEMVSSGQMSMEFGDVHPNAYIKASPSSSVQDQLTKLGQADLHYACVYPSASHLAAVVDQSQYAGQPYTLRLALGAGQLEYVSFDLAVLERYRNDPRYHYDTNDFSGKISITTEHYLSDGMPERDKVLLETFGFGYNKKATVRVVVAFLRYLRHLRREHQELWKSYEMTGEYLLHPVYRDIAVGNWYQGVSIFDAITEEMQVTRRWCARFAARYEVFIASAAMEVPTSFAEKYVWPEEHFPFIPSSHWIFCGDKSALDVDYLVDDPSRPLRPLPGNARALLRPAQPGGDPLPPRPALAGPAPPAAEARAADAFAGAGSGPRHERLTVPALEFESAWNPGQRSRMPLSAGSRVGPYEVVGSSARRSRALSGSPRSA